MRSSGCLDLITLLGKGFYSIPDFFSLARPFPTPGASTALPIVGEWSQNPQEIFRREAETLQVQLLNVSESWGAPGGTTESQNPRLV